MAKWDEPQHRRDHKREEPPNSRLFIVCGKDLTEEDFQISFSKFGTIDEIWIVKDKQTGEKKGVTYIKFSKTSEAALAMEEMNGKCIARSPRPLKVLIAHNRDQGSKREVNEEERLLRLFVVAPRCMSEQDLRAHFTQFGDVEHITLVKDKVTKESKGFGYIKYHKMSHAALAFENCDRSFKAVFADPKPVRSQHPGSTSQHSTPVASEKDLFTGHPVPSISIGVGSSANAVNAGLLRTFPANFDQLSSAGSIENGGNRLVVLASPSLNQDQLWRLFDIVPGLDYCDLRKKVGQGKGVAVVVYNNAQAANYAVEKLHGFEYPPGERLIVKLDTSSPLSDGPHGLDDDRGFPTGYRLPGEVAAGLFGAKPSPVAAAVSGGVGSGHGSGPGGGGGGNGASNGAATATVNAMAAMAAAAAAASQANRYNPEVARLMDTLATCQSLIQAASVNNDSGSPGVPGPGLVGNLLGNVGNAQAANPDMNASAMPPVLGASLLAGLGGLGSGETYDPSYCSVKLPPPQPLAPPDAAVALRLFIVCYPTPPAIFALKDVFGRFGGLIDVYILHNKSYGYAKYASKASAERAVAVLHGQEVCGSRLKVMVAADPHSQNNNANSSPQSSASVSGTNSNSVTASSSPPLTNVGHGSGSSPSSSSSSCHLSDADVTRKRIKMDVDVIDASIAD